MHNAWNPAIMTCEDSPRKKYFENTLEVLTASLHLVLPFHPVDKTITSSNLHSGIEAGTLIPTLKNGAIELTVNFSY